MTIAWAYLNLIRLIHIFGGVSWAGSAIFDLFFARHSLFDIPCRHRYN